MVALLAGCPPFPQSDGEFGGPSSGVVEMDQNTDPRFFFRYRQGAIGRIMVAGKAVWLDGRRLVRDSYIRNGAHVSTGPAGAAIIEFFQSGGMECGLDIREFRRGRIYGSTDRCGHMVVTDQGGMEMGGWPASYHVDVRDKGVTIFTVINGEAWVWRHADPSRRVPVSGYHQAALSRTRISPPRSVTPEEVEAITRWRENFQRLRDLYQSPRDSKPPPVVSEPDLLNRIFRDAWKLFDNPRSRDRLDPPDTDTKPGVDSQIPDTDTKVKTIPTVPIKPKMATPLKRSPAVPIKPYGVTPPEPNLR
ncbi:uncharacterized protein Dmul_17030 [Desulfococcus multivorans]|nr:uncharacterized protein Dmul_17030 [Desulfococcus multivorans]